jgi:LysR family transcriptional regulator, transcriptional activator for dmlA
VKTDAISELSFLVLVARHASLSAAARELNLTPPAVTKRLAQMEQRLGVRLLNRTTRSLSLTAEGELYLAHAGRILADIREMEEQVVGRGGAPKGLLRVNATLGFGRTTIAPLISRFAKAYPDVAVQLRLTDRPLDLVEEAFDLGIRFGALPDTRLSARKVMSNRRFLCAAPSYLKQFGEPQTLAELGAHRCILHRQNNDAPGVWRLTKGRKSESVKVGGTLSSNDGDVVLNWALDGHGILLRSEWDAQKYLASGRLRQVLKDYRPEPADLFVYYPSGRNMPVRLRAFIDFLVQGLNMDKLSD